MATKAGNFSKDSKQNNRSLLLLLLCQLQSLFTESEWVFCLRLVFIYLEKGWVHTKNARILLLSIIYRQFTKKIIAKNAFFTYFFKFMSEWLLICTLLSPIKKHIVPKNCVR